MATALRRSDDHLDFVTSELSAEIVRQLGVPECWAVEAIDFHGEGDVYMAAFTGPLAKERAIEYAARKYSGYKLASS